MRELIGMILITRGAITKIFLNSITIDVKLTFQEVLYEQTIFCHWWEELKWCQGVWAMFKRSWLFLFTTSPTFTWKVSLKTGSTVSIATCVLRTYSFKYTLETTMIISHCIFLSNWPTFLLLAAMLMLFRLWGRTNTSKVNYPRRKVCFQKNLHNYVDKKNLHKRITFSEHVHFWKPLQSDHRLSSEDIAE